MLALAPLIPRFSILALAAGLATPVPARPSPERTTIAGTAQVQEDRAAPHGTGDEIAVTGWRLRKPDTAAPAASRLDLSIRDTPATLDRIGAPELLTRGRNGRSGDASGLSILSGIAAMAGAAHLAG